MASFLSDLWESVFTPGPTHTLLVATNVTFAALQLLFAGLLIATYSIHFAILSVLCGGLWYSINWFANELRQAQAKEAEAERLRRRKVPRKTTVEDSADDEGENTEVEGGLRESMASLTDGDDRRREQILDAVKPSPPAAGLSVDALASGLQAGQGSARQRRGEESASELSTDSEWEKVDNGR